MSMVKEWVDKQYEEGRVTVITDNELVKVIDESCQKAFHCVSIRGRRILSSYELVYQKLRENILYGHYKHGDELRETAVGKETRCLPEHRSERHFSQLELEGLVTIIPNRGAFVNGISEQDVEDIYLIRARLEGLCARMAAEQDYDESRLEEMEETMMLTAFHEEQGTLRISSLELDSQFSRVCSMKHAKVRFWSMN